MPAKKPNILIIWGDDIGWFNVSAYNHGIMVLPTLLAAAGEPGIVEKLKKGHKAGKQQMRVALQSAA